MLEQQSITSLSQTTETHPVSSQSVEVDKVPSFSETMKQYQDAIRKIIDHGIELSAESDPIRNLDEGEIDNVKYRVVFRSGKQQPVRILHFTFPNGVSGEAVLRQVFDVQRIENFFQHPTVREIFPEIYLSHKGVHVIECIQGLEEKRSGEAFAGHLESPDQFRQLVDESFAMIDSLLEDGFTLHDISPSRGHNIIFDINKRKYRFFDVDTLHNRESQTAVMDFFRITEALHNYGNNKRDMAFWFEMIRKYREKHPGATFYHEGEATEIWQVDRLNSLEEAGQYPPESIVMPNNPIYEDRYRAVHWRGAYTQGDDKSKWMPLHKYPQMRREISYIDENFLLACDKGNFESAEKILEQNQRQVILKRSEVVDQEKQ